jgi:hypothetical protein
MCGQGRISAIWTRTVVQNTHSTHVRMRKRAGGTLRKRKEARGEFHQPACRPVLSGPHARRGKTACAFAGAKSSSIFAYLSSWPWRCWIFLGRAYAICPEQSPSASSCAAHCVRPLSLSFCSLFYFANQEHPLTTGLRVITVLFRSYTHRRSRLNSYNLFYTN